jgi:hypothetical protein
MSDLGHTSNSTRRAGDGVEDQQLYKRHNPAKRGGGRMLSLSIVLGMCHP